MLVAFTLLSRCSVRSTMATTYRCLFSWRQMAPCQRWPLFDREILPTGASAFPADALMLRGWSMDQGLFDV
jgi:hypothetical protein